MDSIKKKNAQFQIGTAENESMRTRSVGKLSPHRVTVYSKLMDSEFKSDNKDIKQLRISQSMRKLPEKRDHDTSVDTIHERLSSAPRSDYKYKNERVYQSLE